MKALQFTAAVAAVAIRGALADGDMDMDNDRVEYHPINPGSKTFHWLLTVALLLLLPSISAALLLANKLHWSLMFQFVLLGYSVFEWMFLPFADNTDNHENRTSRGTSTFITLLLGANIFVGTLMNGSNWIMNRFFPSAAGSSQGENSGFLHKLFKTLSVIIALTGWVRVCLAVVALFGFCYGRHTGQCIAHGIMGTAFVFYAMVLAIVLIVPWIRKRDPNRRSQEFYDSVVMCAWGIVNTFTEHRWGKEPWNMGDYQHTAMGIIWWAGALVGVYLTRKKNNHRSVIPALLLVFTGWSMSQHHQHTAISTNVHAFFGLALMGAGFTRIIEICFLLHDKNCDESGRILAFQYMPPFCMTLSGVLFMAATEEQLELALGLGSDHSAYILVGTAAAFVVFLWILLMVNLYLRLVGFDEDGPLQALSISGEEYNRVNDVQEFELENMSE